MKQKTEERIIRMAKRYGYNINDFVGLMIESFNRQDRLLKEIFQIDPRNNEILRVYFSHECKLKNGNNI